MKTSVISYDAVKQALAYKADLLKACKMPVLSIIPCFVLSAATSYITQNRLTQAVGRSV